MYKIETHCHTKESSSCGQVSAKRLVQLYLRAGYDGLVVTDHFNRNNPRELLARGGNPVSFEAQVNRLFQGYWMAKDVAGDSMVVLPGMEIRFEYDINDYLIYGMTAEQLIEHPDIFQWGIEKFSSYAREKGLLIIHAHPFRNDMRIVDPQLIDMVEVYNGHPRQTSRNEIAEYWAKIHDLSGSSGSDFHRDGDEGRGGVLLPEKPTTIKEFIHMMRQTPRLITEGVKYNEYSRNYKNQ